jgi:CCR4-NOT complex subunit CAF16
MFIIFSSSFSQQAATPAVKVNNLNFTYTSTYETKQVLNGLNMDLAPGSRCLLIGANGAGKSTLLRILAGKHLCNGDDVPVKVSGKDAFRDLSLNMSRAYLDTNWGLRTVAFAGYGCPLTADLEVGTMMTELQAEHPERRDELIELLGINPKVCLNLSFCRGRFKRKQYSAPLTNSSLFSMP